MSLLPVTSLPSQSGPPRTYSVAVPLEAPDGSPKALYHATTTARDEASAQQAVMRDAGKAASKIRAETGASLDTGRASTVELRRGEVGGAAIVRDADGRTWMAHQAYGSREQAGRMMDALPGPDGGKVVAASLQGPSLERSRGLSRGAEL